MTRNLETIVHEREASCERYALAFLVVIPAGNLLYRTATGATL